MLSFFFLFPLPPCAPTALELQLKQMAWAGEAVWDWMLIFSAISLQKTRSTYAHPHSAQLLGYQHGVRKSHEGPALCTGKSKSNMTGWRKQGRAMLCRSERLWSWSCFSVWGMEEQSQVVKCSLSHRQRWHSQELNSIFRKLSQSLT